MGSNYKQAVLPPRVGQALHSWHKDAKKRVKLGALFSFGRKRNKSSDGEEQAALRPEDSESSSLSPPMSVIMEENTMPRYDTTTLTHMLILVHCPI